MNMYTRPPMTIIADQFPFYLKDIRHQILTAKRRRYEKSYTVRNHSQNVLGLSHWDPTPCIEAVA